MPYVFDMVRPNSVIDIGCGVGSWLSVFCELGVEDILGIDGSYIDEDMLLIPKEKFHASDITSWPQIGRKFDLILSLEVAEHLDSIEADNYVRYISSLGDVVLFSAAIPRQGGVSHLNEQWPEYWDAKFKESGYRCIDCVRGKFWHDGSVEFWYRQNILLFVRETIYSKYQAATSEIVHPLSIVHPEMLDIAIKRGGVVWRLKITVARYFPALRKIYWHYFRKGKNNMEKM